MAGFRNSSDESEDMAASVGVAEGKKSISSKLGNASVFASDLGLEDVTEPAREAEEAGNSPIS